VWGFGFLGGGVVGVAPTPKPPIPNPQSPIPNPQSPINNFKKYFFIESDKYLIILLKLN